MVGFVFAKLARYVSISCQMVTELASFGYASPNARIGGFHRFPHCCSNVIQSVKRKKRQVGAVDGVRLAGVFVQAGPLAAPNYTNAVKALVRPGESPSPLKLKVG